jgi:hypothetical protein
MAWEILVVNGLLTEFRGLFRRLGLAPLQIRSTDPYFAG